MTDPKPLAICECEHEEVLHWPESKDQYKLRRCSYLGCDCELYTPEVAAPLPEPTSRPKPWNAHQRTNERLASELSEATLIIRGFLVFPAMTMDQRKECIDDARKFLKTIGL